MKNLRNFKLNSKRNGFMSKIVLKNQRLSKCLESTLFLELGTKLQTVRIVGLIWFFWEKAENMREKCCNKEKGVGDV